MLGTLPTCLSGPSSLRERGLCRGRPPSRQSIQPHPALPWPVTLSPPADHTLHPPHPQNQSWSVPEASPPLSSCAHGMGVLTLTSPPVPPSCLAAPWKKTMTVSDSMP